MNDRSLQGRRITQEILFGLFRLAMLLVVISLGAILVWVMVQGLGVFFHGVPFVDEGWSINWGFLTEAPEDQMRAGGIFPAILGTFLLTVGAILVALPLGVASAIYLSEYAHEGRFLRIVRLGIQNLAGVPSVVFGLFGVALFVILLDFGISLLAGSLTLGLLILPTVVGAAEEALRAVPSTFREASLGLGATTWQTIRKVVLPAAMPGILTGSILAIGRAAGETAPIMFTAATFYTRGLPESVFDQVMALPFHIFVLATAGTHINQTRPIQYGTVLVLITLVLSMSLIAIVMRTRMRRKKNW